MRNVSNECTFATVTTVQVGLARLVAGPGVGWEDDTRVGRPPPIDVRERARGAGCDEDDADPA